MTGEKVSNSTSALEALLQISDPNDPKLNPRAVQAAINELDPTAENAIEDAELVNSFATTGQMVNPESEDWWEVMVRAQKVLENRIAASEH